jgi:hypothetical protein
MLIVLGITAAGADNYAMPIFLGRCLVLEGTSEVLMPRVGLVMHEGNWTCPYDYYLIYPYNQTISGTHFEPDRLAGSSRA